MDGRFVLLLACFFLSGFAALLYQTAWTRELSFVFGTSELAVAAVLAAYMGGLALGAAAAARFAVRVRRPVLVYGVLELAIALCALSVPSGIWLINALYVGAMGGGSELQDAGLGPAAFQLGAAFAVLLPPTAFMGATLPLLARHAVRSEAEIGSRVGVLYAVNTAGAIAGTLCAAFWLMPELGLRHTVWVGAAMNGLVFALAALLSRHAANPTTASPASFSKAPPADASERAGGAGAPPASTLAGGASRWILPAIALSGAASFAYEVLWTRLLGHLLGGSLDAFATMLASFLLGITLGSAIAARIAKTRAAAALGFAVAQLGIALTSYGIFALADQLPQLSLMLGAGPSAPLASAAVAAATLLPITLFIGATFPFAVRLLARSPEHAANATASVYAWNTLGAIAGALGAGFVLLPQLGFAGTLGVGVAANLVLAAITGLSTRPQRRRLALAAAVAAVLLLALPPRTPWSLLSSSPIDRQASGEDIVFSAVGRSATVLVFDRWLSFNLTSNGLPEAKILRSRMLPLAPVAHWLGLLPTLLRPDTRELLVIGLGGGSVVERVPSTVETVDVIELEPEVLKANQFLAAVRAIDPLADPRIHVHIADARGALQLTEKRYDAIVSQPSHPWTAGASHLYTREFFTLVRSRLAPNGVFVQWIGLAFVDEPLLRSLAATLVHVFGHVEVYQPGGQRGVLFAASPEKFDMLDSVERALRAAPEDLARFGLQSVEDAVSVRVLDEAGTRAFAEGGALNTDDLNLLASRASRLGDAKLDPYSVRKLWGRDDPLLGGADGMEGLDRSALIRRLVASNFKQRANALAMSQKGALQETGLGWLELGLNRSERAARHFARALELAPDSRDAVAGLVASRRMDFVRGRPVAGVDPKHLEAPLAAVIAAWRHAESENWEALAALDPELARVAAGEPLFEEASRLRARWRLARPDREKANEALALAETLLLRKWEPRDALLRARAAVAAGQPAAAWGSLSRIAERLPHYNEPAALLEPALEIAMQLPDEIAAELQRRLKSSRRGAPGR